MDLWIRSQDRTMLCKPQYIELCCDSEVHYGDVNIGYRCVATYKTKERALEVLDEIQKLLKPKVVVKAIDTSAKIDDDLVYRPQQNMEIITLSNAIVYEMPKE